MKKDIPFHPVQGVQVAVVRSINESQSPEWNVVAINKNDEPITNVFVTSKGYENTESGMRDGKKTLLCAIFF